MIDNILIIKHGAFGDFVQSLGCLRAIRAHHAGDRITLMTTAPFEALARASGYIDDVFVDGRPKWYGISEWLGLRAWFRAQNFSRVYDLQNSERTGAYFKFFSGGAAWCRADIHEATRRGKHVFQALVDQLARAGIAPVTHDDLRWIQADIAAFSLPEKYALIVAGCSAKHPLKRWPAENYAALCGWLLTRGITPVLLGTKDEAAVTAQLKQACSESIDLTGKTSLMQIAVLARGAVCAVGNDTGPLHMIGPTGCPTLGLYPGFSNPARHGPLGAHVKTIQRWMMADITVEEVVSKILSS